MTRPLASRVWRRQCRALALGLVLGAGAGTFVRAEPIVPAADDQIIERLPATAVARRAASRGAPAAGRSVSEAVAEARALIDAARAEGDPRAAGQALAVLAPWSADPNAPPAAALMLATAEQFLHDFDGATRRLEALVARDPRNPQAWLVLATLRRLRGHYAESDAACRQIAALQVYLHAAACLAENQALRGDSAGARRALQPWIAGAADPGARNWLLTTLAELEQRDGRPREAEAAYRAALAADADGYTALALADLLIDQQRPRDALAVLKDQPRSDAVLLRLVIAGAAAGTPQAAADGAELRERFEQAALRPGATAGHAREHAMYQLTVQHDPARALALARENLKQQREPIDLLIYARAARAAQDGAALQHIVELQHSLPLHDRRIDAVAAR